MLISKFDLYKSEWLDLVFDNRNKEYGAYNLRQSYSDTMVKSMGFTFSGVALVIGLGFLLKSAPVSHHRDVSTVVTISELKPAVLEVKKPKLPVAQQKTLPPARTTKLVPFVVEPDSRKVENPPETIDIKGAVGQTTTAGSDETSIIPPASASGSGSGMQPVADESIHAGEGIDVMPEPVGGVSAWSKFLNKNLRYPGEAQDQQVSGRVILSFVVEKDGHLSNIVVERPAGYGFDEEAVRVLKLAKAWKPGMQNGQPVRVKYTIPINFQVAEQ